MFPVGLVAVCHSGWSVRHNWQKSTNHLRKLVHLFHKSRKRCRNTNIDQTLDILYSLLISQVQPELVLHLNISTKTSSASTAGHSRSTTARPYIFGNTCMHRRYLQITIVKHCLYYKHSSNNQSVCYTFLTVLSGSRAISGTFASTIRENRFNIKFADLQVHHTKIL